MGITVNADNEQHPSLSLVEFQTTEESFRQPTEAEVSLLAFGKFSDARSHEQELSNEFARLLNRGSSLE